jgi:hypothetical protein
MPKRPLRPCRKPGCPELTDAGYCDQHRPKDKRPSANAHRVIMALTGSRAKAIVCGYAAVSGTVR